jgi:hypothetical protein
MSKMWSTYDKGLNTNNYYPEKILRKKVEKI